MTHITHMPKLVIALLVVVVVASHGIMTRAEMRPLSPVEMSGFYGGDLNAC